MLLFSFRLPAGYCFVEFRDGPSAQKAMLRLNGKIIPNSQPVGETIVIENRYHLP